MTQLLLACIDECIHQICHKDGETNGNTIAANKRLQNLFKPGSFIIPLEDERKIYIGTPDEARNVITVYKGQILFFAGDVPHGGITYERSSKGSNEVWHIGLHGHLDSTKHDRYPDFLDLEPRTEFYLPREHCHFYARHCPNKFMLLMEQSLEMVREGVFLCKHSGFATKPGDSVEKPFGTEGPCDGFEEFRHSFGALKLEEPK